MKKILLIFSLILSILLSAQNNVIPSEKKMKIPFICNKQIDQYMADYQSFVNLMQFVVQNGDNKLKQKVSTEYTLLIQKYSDINRIIAGLNHEQQRQVAEFIREKGIEITKLTQKEN